MALYQKTATELLGLLSSGQVTSEELTRAYAERIANIDKQVGAYLRVDVDGALEQARVIDARRKRGEKLGLLAGLPVAVKDLLTARGDLATCASRMLETYRATYDSTVVA